MTRIPVVVEVKVLEPYVIKVTFEDGEQRQIDLADQLLGEIFEPLHDPALFAQAAVDPVWRTVVWPNGADLAPEFLYEKRGRVKARATSQAPAEQSKPRKARKQTHGQL